MFPKSDSVEKVASIFSTISFLFLVLTLIPSSEHVVSLLFHLILASGDQHLINPR